MLSDRSTLCYAELSPEQKVHFRTTTTTSIFSPAPEYIKENLIASCHIVSEERIWPYVRFNFESMQELNGDMHHDMRLLNSIDQIVNFLQRKGLLPIKELTISCEAFTCYDKKKCGLTRITPLKLHEEAKSFSFIHFDKDHFSLMFGHHMSHRYHSEILMAFAELKARQREANEEHSHHPKARL